MRGWVVVARIAFLQGGNDGNLALLLTQVTRRLTGVVPCGVQEVRFHGLRSGAGEVIGDPRAEGRRRGPLRPSEHADPLATTFVDVVGEESISIGECARRDGIFGPSPFGADPQRKSSSCLHADRRQGVENALGLDSRVSENRAHSASCPGEKCRRLEERDAVVESLGRGNPRLAAAREPQPPPRADGAGVGDPWIDRRMGNGIRELQQVE